MNKTIKLAVIVVAASLTFCLLAGCQSSPKTKDNDELDMAIYEVSQYLNMNVQRGTKIAIISIKSDHQALSEYVINNLTERIVNDRVFTVVERAQLETIRAELNLNMSGDVDDDSALRIGKMSGAQTMVMGSVTPIGSSSWQMSVRILDVESAELLGFLNKNIRNTGKINEITTGKSTTAKEVLGGLIKRVYR